MIVVTEKRPVVGTLKTLCGTYHLLHKDFKALPNSNLYSFYGVDDEGFENWITANGDFVYIPVLASYMVDVKRVVTESEAQEVEILDSVSID